MFSSLFSPIALGPLRLRNRIIMPAMELNYADQGRVSDRLIDFYAERAEGGAAVLIVGGCTVSPEAGIASMLSLKDDEVIPGMRRLAAAIHEHGALAAVQLYHAGAYAHAALSGHEAVSASPHTSAFTRQPCRGLDIDEIPALIQKFVDAAQRAYEAGFDLVELSASAGYLVCQFLSPLINKRDDRYGGSTKNRMRFAVELLEALRAAVPEGRALGVRIAGHDFVPGSGGNAEARDFAAAIAPLVDLIDVTGGWHQTRVPQLPAEVPRGAFVHLAAGIAQAVDVPVAASNRLGDPALAARVVASGQADLICLGRPLIADPFWPHKVQAQRLDALVPCTACNQMCFDRVLTLQPVGCMVNPRAGLESERKRPKAHPAPAPLHVVVVGAGVAGCSAAITAAERGHRVTLLEAEPEIGGQVSWAAGPTDKPEFPTLLGQQRARLHELGVDLRQGIMADVDAVRALHPDQVILATGAQAVTPGIPGVERPEVVQAWDVMRDRAAVGRRVVVVGGGSVGCELAVWLAREGTLSAEQIAFLLYHDAEDIETLRRLQRQGLREVSVVEQRRRLAGDLGSRRWIVVDAMRKHGVRSLKNCEVLAIEEGGVRLRRGDSDEELLPCDTVVLAVGSRSRDSDLQAALESAGLSVHVVGDQKKVAKIPDAIASGYLAAMAL